jgi:hypothetical protein
MGPFKIVFLGSAVFEKINAATAFATAAYFEVIGDLNRLIGARP